MNDSGNIPFGSARPKVYTVSALTEEIKDLLEERFDFFWVEAEISNFRSPSSGHYYMALKDELAQIRAVMFRPQTRYLRFRPEDGMKVIARGRIGVYEPRGEYQIILDYLEPLGVGAMALAFEQLKKKLAEKGLFDEDIKRPLPFLPQRVAVITSPTGAAIHDFLKVIHRRFANIEITIIPVKVQGDGAAEEMVEAIAIANTELEADLIVLTRGGGSMEDLWAFNSEDLAYAIRASRLPVVSAVGHEIDVTISDLAADLRAPTPSAAAEIIVMEKESLQKELADLKEYIRTVFLNNINNMKLELSVLKKGLRDPGKNIADSWMKLDDLNGRIIRDIKQILAQLKKNLNAENRAILSHSPAVTMSSLKRTIAFNREMLSHIISKRIYENRMTLSLFEQKLKDLSPYSVLSRGYSITRTLPDRKVLRSTSGVTAGDRVNIIVTDGELFCLIEDKTETERVQ